MSVRAHGQIRRSQVITTWGPGAPIDLPRDAGIVGGLETWPKTSDLEEVVDPRLARKLGQLTGVANPRLFAPPPDAAAPGEPALGIGVFASRSGCSCRRRGLATSRSARDDWSADGHWTTKAASTDGP